MKVSDLLNTKSQTIITITPDKPVFEAMQTLMDHQISSLLVLDTSSKMVGIITERDIIRALHQNYEALKLQTVADLMSTNLIVVNPDDEIESAMEIMTQNRIRHLPIITERGLVGIISIGDLVKFQLKEIQVENRYLEDYISGNYYGW